VTNGVAKGFGYDVEALAQRAASPPTQTAKTEA
jgi:hypothetical protein